MKNKGPNYSPLEDYLIVKASIAGEKSSDIAKTIGGRSAQSIRQRRKLLRKQGKWELHAGSEGGAK